MVQLYLDIDGVFADFNYGFKLTTGKDIETLSKEELYKCFDLITELGFEYWLNLPLMNNAKKLWNVTKNYNPKFLSASLLKGHNNAEKGKTMWIKKYFGNYEVIVLRSAKLKYQYCKYGDILIDDNLRNITKWKEAGGIGILYEDKNVDFHIKQFKKEIRRAIIK